MPDKFQLALSLHQQGKYKEARAGYEEILKVQPNHCDALHLLGVIMLQSGDPQQALPLLDKAIALNPKQATYYANRGSLHLALGKLQAAQADFDQAIALKPDFAAAYASRASLNASFGKPGAALADFDRAIALKPDFVEAFGNRGNLNFSLGKLEAAQADFDQAITLRPDFADAFGNRGNLNLTLGKLEAAQADFDRAIALRPDFAKAYSNRGNLNLTLGKLEAAQADFDRAIVLRPDLAEAYCGRGNLNLWLGKLDAGQADFDQAIAQKPTLAEAYCNRGSLNLSLGKLEEARADCDRAIALKPDFGDAYSNRGNLHLALGELEAAEADYDRAIAIAPDSGLFHYNKALLLLSNGDMEHGWGLYERRWENPKFPEAKRKLQQPLWQGGQSLAGKTILLACEQGLGDTIQFCRYAPMVKQLGARVLLEVQAPLARLLDQLAGVDELLTRGGSLPEFDVYCPLLSLPYAFKTRLNSIPSSQGYLHATPEKISEWETRLGRKHRPRVGLVWSGNARHVNDRYRSIPLAQLVSNLPPDCDYFSLQKDLREDDEAKLHANCGIRHFGDALGDFTDTAALCALMDLVICVDTSVAHLSAALGLPTWILLSSNVDWRWMRDRADSPWYASATLYRQSRRFDWSDVLERVSDDLLRRFQ